MFGEEAFLHYLVYNRLGLAKLSLFTISGETPAVSLIPSELLVAIYIIPFIIRYQVILYVNGYPTFMKLDSVCGGKSLAVELLRHPLNRVINLHNLLQFIYPAVHLKYLDSLMTKVSVQPLLVLVPVVG